MSCKPLDFFSIPLQPLNKRDENVYILSLWVFSVVVISFLIVEAYLRFSPSMKNDDGPCYRNIRQRQPSEEVLSTTPEELQLDKLTLENTQFNKTIGKLYNKPMKMTKLDSLLIEKDSNINTLQEKYSFSHTNTIMRAGKPKLRTIKSATECITPTETLHIKSDSVIAKSNQECGKDPNRHLSWSTSEETLCTTPPRSHKHVRFLLSF